MNSSNSSDINKNNNDESNSENDKKEQKVEFNKIDLQSWRLSQIENKKSKAEKIDIGDYVRLNYLVVEGDRERLQAFEGVVIAKKGGPKSLDATITIRRTSKGYNIERVFPCFSPRIDSIKVIKKSKIRRAKLYYLRELSGKKARLQEKI